MKTLWWGGGTVQHVGPLVPSSWGSAVGIKNSDRTAVCRGQMLWHLQGKPEPTAALPGNSQK